MGPLSPGGFQAQVLFCIFSDVINVSKNVFNLCILFEIYILLQPINDVVDYPMANSNQFTNHNPQTPSSIPNIILTGNYYTIKVL